MQPSRRSRKHQTVPFNLMVAGHKLVGKSDFLATLLETQTVHRIVEPKEPQAPFLPSVVGDSLDRASVSSVAVAPGSLLALQLQSLSVSGAAPSPLPPSNCSQPTPGSAGVECDMPFGATHERLLLQLIDSPGLEVPSGLYVATTPEAEAAAQLLAAKYLKNLLSYIEAQFEATLLEESKVRRNPNAPDFQTHACVYLISPEIALAAKGLSAVDRIVLKKLATRVNVIPCLAQTDMLTVRQLKSIRQLVANDLAFHEIAVYSFPEEDIDEDEQPLNLKSLLPFRIINSENESDDSGTGITVNGKKVLGREFAWGVVEVTNPEHCDFIELTNALFGSHIEDLKTHTKEVLYENWRTDRLVDGKGISFPRGHVDPRRPSHMTVVEE